MITRTFIVENDKLMVKGVPGQWDVYIQTIDNLTKSKIWKFLDTNTSIDAQQAAVRARQEWLDIERAWLEDDYSSHQGQDVEHE